MSGPVEICNKALRLLGRGPIASLDDNTTDAYLMKSMYEPAKQQILRMYDWNCAKREEDVLVGEEANYSHYAYQFPWPVDCIRVMDICEPTGYTNPLFDVDGVRITDSHDIRVTSDGSIRITAE